MPASRPISRNRFEFELLVAPTTKITSTSLVSSRSADLAILCRVADILRARPDHVLEAAVQRSDDAARVVDAERGLRHIGDRRIGREDRAPSTSASVCTSRTGPGIWPSVPSTSGWPAWPISTTVRPCAQIVAALRCAPWRPAGRWRSTRAGRAPAPRLRPSSPRHGR